MRAVTVSRAIPAYLKLHVESTPGEVPQPLVEFPVLGELCQDFERITGWSLRYESGDVIDGSYFIDRPARDVAKTRDSVGREDAEQFARTIGDLVVDLQRTRRELWLREAEVAAIGSVVEREDDETHLAARLESVLRGGTEAVGCKGAALYLLDEATSQLKLRSSWGLPKQKFAEQARPLRGAVADLEALIGHAVVLEDTSLLPNWKPPEGFTSAVCVPVSTPTTILGTLWVFDDEVRGYTENQTNMIEICAGRVAADLEREMLLHHSNQSTNLDQHLVNAARWQQQREPSIKPPLDDWQLAGCTSRANCVGSDIYDWNVIADGRLAVLVGNANERSIEGALTAATLQTAVNSHSSYTHTAEQLLDRVNTTLWSASTGGQLASLGYVLFDPELGAFEFASAGKVGAVVLRRDGCEVVSHDTTPLATDETVTFHQYQQQLAPGDALILFSDGVRQAIHQQGQPIGDEAIAAALQGHSESSADELLELIRALIDTYSAARPAVDRTVVVVRRRP